MRPIKFRAWNENTKKMVDLKKITPLALSEGMRDGLFLPFPKLGDTIDDNYILEQFTGLKDSKGKDIYEGDIVVSICRGHDPLNKNSEDEFRGIVVYDTNGFGVQTKDCKKGESECPLFVGGGWKTKVIGNIHEHKYLLEGTNDTAKQ